jgi:ADP-ribose pyrophosphatase YjhB (NUDIX family)
MALAPQLVTSAELDDLRNRYGSFRECRWIVTVGPEYQKSFLEQKLRERRGEVVYLVRDGASRLLLHTKSSYPEGVYRLPSGGVNWSEDVRTALLREVAEETGFVVRSDELGDPPRSVPFVSFVFAVTCEGDGPRSRDPDEAITDFRWVALEELPRVAAELRALEQDHPRHGDWGRFRAVVHDQVWNDREILSGGTATP